MLAYSKSQFKILTMMNLQKEFEFGNAGGLRHDRDVTLAVTPTSRKMQFHVKRAFLS